MNYNDRYNRIHKHIILLALFPQSGYKFKYVCRLLSQGIMKASLKPVDIKLTERDWFKAGIRLLVKPLVDEDSAESPDDLNIPDGVYKTVCEGFKKFVKSVRWYLNKLDHSDEREWEDDGFPVFNLEEEFNSAYALLKWIVYQIDGGTLSFRACPEADEKISPHTEESLLLFHSDTKIGVREFCPWSLEGLDKECRKGENLGKKLISEELWRKRDEIRNNYDRFMDDFEAGDKELDELLDYYEFLIPDLPIEKLPMPPPPPRTEEKQPVEKNEEKDPTETEQKIRFTVKETDGSTFYTDNILGITYKISNGCGAKKKIDKLIEDLKLNRVEQLYPTWGKVKGLFMRDDAAKFAKQQIYHEPKQSFDERYKCRQFTGRWRIHTDTEIKAKMKGKKQVKSR